METRANHIWVGAVSVALLAVLAAFIIWISRLNQADQNEYDIFFKQSVEGLAKGSAVTFAGVPAGQIKKIELWRKDPSFVRVRISIDDTIPILQGTTATIQGSFTGVSDILLNGAVRGAPPITELGPEGVPVIPTKAGGLGAILANAPLLVERLATLTERLNILMSDKNQQSIEGILQNTEKMTANLADASPQAKQAVAELQVTLKQATQTLAAFEQLAGSADKLVNGDGAPLADQLRATLRSAQKAADALEVTLADARPATRRLTDETLPAAESAMRELKAATRALRNVTEKIEQEGAGALVGAAPLPEYKP